MIQERVISKWLQEVKIELDRRAHDNMAVPKRDLFEYGVSVGEYQGLKLAEQILKDVLRDVDQ